MMMILRPSRCCDDHELGSRLRFAAGASTSVTQQTNHTERRSLSVHWTILLELARFNLDLAEDLVVYSRFERQFLARQICRY